MGQSWGHHGLSRGHHTITIAIIRIIVISSIIIVAIIIINNIIIVVSIIIMRRGQDAEVLSPSFTSRFSGLGGPPIIATVGRSSENCCVWTPVAPRDRF